MLRRSLGLGLCCALVACSDDGNSAAGGYGGGSAGSDGSGGDSAAGGSGGEGAGNSGGSGGGVPSGVAITFPTPFSLTDRDTITVRGTASLSSGINGINVGGVPASSDDGFEHWAAEVPLAMGVQSLSVDVEGPQPVTDAASVEIDRRATLGQNPDLLAVDVEGQRAFIGSGSGGYDLLIRAIDLNTGEQTVVTGMTFGSGPDFDDDLVTLSWDPGGQRLLAFDAYTLWSIDVDSGARSVIYNKPAGGPPWPADENEAEVDSIANRIIATTAAASEYLIAIDLDTPSITILSSSTGAAPSIGAGPDLDEVHGLALDLANGRALVVDDDTATGLVSIDLASGDRTVLSNALVGTGPWTALPGRVAFSDGTAYVSTYIGAEVFAVNLASNTRSIVVNQVTGSGPAMLSATGLEAYEGALLLTDTALDAVVSIDPATLVRTIASGYNIGAGRELWQPQAAAWDPYEDRLVTSDLTGIVSIDPATGEREVLSSHFFGPGSGIFGISFNQDIAVLPDAFLLGIGGAIARIDRATGDRTIFSGMDAGGQPVGEGPTVQGVRGFAISDDGSQAWMTGIDGTVLSVDPATGDREIVSSSTMGVGPMIEQGRDLVYDEANGRLLATSDLLTVIAVDLATGDRTILSSPDVGSGPPAFGWAFLRPEGFYVTYDHIWTIVDLTTGDRTRVIEGVNGPGFYAGGHAIQPGGLFYATDHFLGAALAIDPQSGERVVISR